MICFLHVRKVQQKHGCGTTEVSLIFPTRQSLCVHALSILLFPLRRRSVCPCSLWRWKHMQGGSHILLSWIS